MFLVIFLTGLSFLVSSIVIWWGVFLTMTLVFIMLNKFYGVFSSLFNYFVLQETTGLMFLLVYSGAFQCLLVMLKMGVSPLHFWLFSVMGAVRGYSLVWFLTFQKLPFTVVLVQLFWFICFYVIIFGLVFCYLQIFLYKSSKMMLLISSAESFNWILLFLVFSLLNFFFFFFAYFLVLLFLLSGHIGTVMGWETTLIFLNIPLSVNFFIKIFSLIYIMDLVGFFLLLVLFLMFLSFLCFSFWLVSLSSFYLVQSQTVNYNFMGLILFFFILMLCAYSKMYYSTLI